MAREGYIFGLVIGLSEASYAFGTSAVLTPSSHTTSPYFLDACQGRCTPITSVDSSESPVAKTIYQRG